MAYGNLLSPTFLGRTKEMMSSLGLGPAVKSEEASPHAPAGADAEPFAKVPGSLDSELVFPMILLVWCTQFIRAVVEDLGASGDAKPSLANAQSYQMGTTPLSILAIQMTIQHMRACRLQCAHNAEMMCSSWLLHGCHWFDLLSGSWKGGLMLNSAPVVTQAPGLQKIAVPRPEDPTLADKPAAPIPAEEIPAAPPGPLEMDVLSIGTFICLCLMGWQLAWPVSEESTFACIWIFRSLTHPCAMSLDCLQLCPLGEGRSKVGHPATQGLFSLYSCG